ncbi:hypothetical protein BCR35DRAFT_321354 [Leucosporidium creatinivorum]|uniref:Ammonium transporter AmtB-like domain-containing protein n=1 Tax=Leucosporidium creatinivorum TaxID=106004 RepID=A0A1Y2FBC9_9BASI|nr:hypothetical protein BCR35DRAFT_321354 [Leucosporidium creatinivorum]
MGMSADDFLALSADYNAGDMAWIASATVFCWGIIPGIGYLYSGYTDKRNALSTVLTSFMTLAIGSISWMTMGYSLTYGVGNGFIGDATLFGHAGVMGTAVYAIPELEYSIFQLVFSVATVAIFMGGAAERARLSCLPVIIFLWPLVVYSPIAHWTWASNGWLYVLGAYDFAGGSPVHIASGTSALAMSVYLSHPLFRSRKNKSRALKLVEHKPENLFALSLSLVLIWGGWLAFDGGSTLALNLRSFVAMNTTQLSGSMGGFVWTMLHFAHTKKWSLAGFVSGAICGLVGITPGCGYVGLPASLLIGAVTSGACYYADKLRHCSLAVRYNILDPAGVFISHAVGGMIGNCMTGIFAQASIAATDGATVIPGGWLDGNFRQLGLQLADCCAVTTYSFVVTYLLVALIDCVPGLEVLATEEDIRTGMDEAGCGESFEYTALETRPFMPAVESTSYSPERSRDGKDSEKGAATGQVLEV